MATILHGSSLPGALEGAPFHNDSFLLSFNAEADTNGVNVYVGALVTLATDADFTCVISVVADTFILGVAQTSGQLQSAIDVICRGEVTVVTDDSITAGDKLTFSSDAGHDGMVALTANASRMVALQTVDGSVTPAPLVAFLF